MKRFWILFIFALLCVVLAACGIIDTFEGDKISKDDSFIMNYTLFNRKESAFLPLETGDSVRVSIAQEKGTVDITVGIDGKDCIYDGNGLKNISFTLHISESGAYLITVVGHNACGSVSFIKTATS